MMTDVVTAKDQTSNPYRDIANSTDSGRIVLDLEGNPKVIEQAPKNFFGKTISFVLGEGDMFDRFHSALATRDFIKRGKEIYGDVVFNFAFPPKEQKKFLDQDLIFSTEKNQEVLKEADRLFEIMHNIHLPGVDSSIAEAHFIAQELQKKCTALENPTTHLSEAALNYANVALHCTLLGIIFSHPIPLTAHIAIDAAEAGIFARADIRDKFEKANAALSRFSNATEARNAAHDAVKTAIHDAETSLEELRSRALALSPSSVAMVESPDEDLNVKALKKIINSL